MNHKYRIGDIVYRKNDKDKVGYEIVGIDNYTYRDITIYIVSTDYSTLRWFTFEIGGIVKTKEEVEKTTYNDLLIYGFGCLFFAIVILMIIMKIKLYWVMV